jgi:hypothetical protein
MRQPDRARRRIEFRPMRKALENRIQVMQCMTDLVDRQGLVRPCVSTASSSRKQRMVSAEPRK